MAETQQRKVIITPITGGTLQLSDYRVSGYVNCITAWETISDCKIDPITYSTSPGAAAFRVFNSMMIGVAARFSDITGLQFGAVRILQGATEIFRGVIDEITDITMASCKINCVTVDAGLSKKFQYEVINPTDYPDADLADFGEMLPIVLGNALRVPFRHLAIGYMEQLSEALEAGDTEITSAQLPNFSQLGASGELKIGSYFFDYTVTGNTLTLTTPVTKYIAKGSLVIKVLSEYICAIGNPVASIDSVYLAGALLPPVAYDAFTGQTGDEHASYPGKAVISLLENPISVVTSTNPPSIRSGAGAMGDVACPSLDSAPIETAPSSGDLYPQQQSEPPAADGSAFDKNTSSYFDSQVTACEIVYWATGGSNYFMTEFRFPALCSINVPGEITGVTLHILADVSFSTTKNSLNIENHNGEGITVADDGACSPTVEPTWYSYAASDWNAMEITNLRVYCHASDTVTFFRIHEIYFEITYDQASSENTISSPVVSISSTGKSQTSIGKLAQVSADVTGLYPKPNDMMEYLLTALCGLSSALLNAASYIATEAQYDSESYAENLVISSPPNIPELLSWLGFNAKTIQYWKDTHYLRFMNGSYMADATLTSEDVDHAKVSMSYTNKNYVANLIAGDYNKYWASNVYNESVEAEDATSQSVYGQQQLALDLGTVESDTQAQDVADWALSDRQDPRLMIQFDGGFTNLLARRIGDILAFDVTDAYLDALLCEMVEASHRFLIIERNCSQRSVQIVCVRIE